jgi:hypothetical protein
VLGADDGDRLRILSSEFALHRHRPGERR